MNGLLPFKPIDPSQVTARLAAAEARVASLRQPEIFQHCYACLDLTSLNPLDSALSVKVFVDKVAAFKTHFPAIPQVAAVCVYPEFVEVAGLELGDSEVAIAAVAGGFPSSHSFLEVKMLECAMAEENGADEIDIVLNLGEFRDGNDEAVAGEIETIRAELDAETRLKVILESGLLPSLSDVYRASIDAMCGGADFIKTSTGKNGPGASPGAFLTMCLAAQDFHAATGRRVGVKVAGGVATAGDAIRYYAIVQEALGDAWLTPEFFRIGASGLANNLLSTIKGEQVFYF